MCATVSVRNNESFRSHYSLTLLVHSYSTKATEGETAITNAIERRIHTRIEGEIVSVSCRIASRGPTVAVDTGAPKLTVADTDKTAAHIVQWSASNIVLILCLLISSVL